MVGKFFAEAIEHADQAPVEAVRACGGSRLQILWHGILPQVFPQMADVSFCRWEYNFRASTVMGMVGCGGTGFPLISSLNLMDDRQVTALLLIILFCVTVVDALSARMRRRFQQVPMNRPLIVLTHRVFPETLKTLGVHGRVWSPDGETTADRGILSDLAREASAMMVFLPGRIDQGFLERCPRLRIAACGQRV